MYTGRGANCSPRSSPAFGAPGSLTLFPTLGQEYEPLHFQLGQPHPDAVVETTSLSFADLPRITYNLSIPRAVLKPATPDNPHGGALSRLQLETVAYACQQHELRLPDGARRGFFLGDGVGLGKGRQLAGIPPLAAPSP